MSKDINEKLKKLSEEFPRDKVTFRPGNLTKDKSKALPLAYIDARDAMNRLDDVLGAGGWKDKYEFHGARIICFLSIKVNDEWVTKCDGAGESKIESEKGGLSDAFKRTAVKWGVGRYLYGLHFKYAKLNKWKQFEDKDMWKHLIKDGKKGGNMGEDEPKPELKPDPKEYVALLDRISKKTTVAELDGWEKEQPIIDARDKLFQTHPELSAKVDEAIKLKYRGFKE